MSTRDGCEWLDNEGRFLFGKWEGESVENVALDDPSYLRWILNTIEDIFYEDRDIIETALQYTEYIP